MHVYSKTFSTRAKPTTLHRHYSWNLATFAFGSGVLWLLSRRLYLFIWPLNQTIFHGPVKSMYSFENVLEWFNVASIDIEMSAFIPAKLWYNCSALLEHIETRDVRDPYQDELYTILSLIACGYRGAFIRYGDGEMALAQGRAIPVQSQATLVDHFTWDLSTQSALGRRIVETLLHPAPSVFYAISCTGCAVSINKEISPFIRQRPGMWSYSVLFHNSNYPAFEAWLRLLSSPLLGLQKRRQLLGGRKLILIVNEESRDRDLSWADAVQYLPNECVRRYEKYGDGMLDPFLHAARSAGATVFLVSGGPLAKWLIYKMQHANPGNFYVDVGSSIDVLIKGRVTRPFHTNPGTHVCVQN